MLSVFDLACKNFFFFLGNFFLQLFFYFFIMNFLLSRKFLSLSKASYSFSRCLTMSASKDPRIALCQFKIGSDKQANINKAGQFIDQTGEVDLIVSTYIIIYIFVYIYLSFLCLNILF